MEISTTAALPPGGKQSRAAEAAIGAAATTPKPAPTEAREPAAVPPPVLDVDLIKRSMEKVKIAVAPVAHDLQFSMDEDSGRPVVRVIDTTTQEVIRQIPGEEVLRMAKELDRMQGLLLRQTA